VRKPVNIVYGVDDRPPLAVTALSGLQHIGLISIFLLFPLAVAREAGLTDEQTSGVLGASMLALGASTMLQALNRGPIGSGFLCPSAFTAAYLGPSLLAVNTGGLPLVFGMTVFAGCVEAALSQALRYLRPYFPPEIAGFVVAMIGVTIGALGVRYVLGVGNTESATALDLAVSALSLGIMIGLNVWSGGVARLFCALVGMIAGYALAGSVGILTQADLAWFIGAPFLAIPQVGELGWSFELTLAVPFAVGAIAACLRCVGDITTCQKINDADWVRPGIRSIGKGVLADGLGTIVAGAVGTVGVNSSPGSVGIASATGVTSRHVAFAVGITFTVLAFVPKVPSFLVIMPRPVIGAALLLSACFVFVNGLQIITSRLLDARRTFVIGLSFIAGIAVDIFPAYFHDLPLSLRPLFGSSLAVGMLCALLLNLVFRIGVRKTQRFFVHSGEIDPVKIEEFMEAQGAAWGARRDVIDRAKFNLVQSIEVIVESCKPHSPVEVEASFDEFNLNLRVSYTGAPLELPEKRPSNEEIMASDAGQRKLAGFMLRRYADRVQATHKVGRSTILFHFDH
jgi:xanthine permease XanP